MTCTLQATNALERYRQNAPKDRTSDNIKLLKKIDKKRTPQEYVKKVQFTFTSSEFFSLQQFVKWLPRFLLYMNLTLKQEICVSARLFDILQEVKTP